MRLLWDVRVAHALVRILVDVCEDCYFELKPTQDVLGGVGTGLWGLFRFTGVPRTTPPHMHQPVQVRFRIEYAEQRRRN